MMKQVLSILVLMVLVAWPQLWLTSYPGIIIAWVFTGAIMSWFRLGKLIFLKGLIAEILVAGIIYFLMGRERSGWIVEVLESNDLSEGTAAFTFVAFNALNVAFCLLFGSAFVSLIRPGKERGKA